MSQDNTKQQRRWLPEKKLRESISFENRIALFIALVSVVLFAVLDSVPRKPDIVEIIASLGITLSGIVLGFCLSNCWTEWKRGSSRRVKAIQIDNYTNSRIEETKEDFKSVVNTLSTLITDDNSEEQRMSMYFLTQKILELEKVITRQAREIEMLDYDNEEFLRQKEENFRRMQGLIDHLVNSISKSANIESLTPFVEELKAKSQLAYNRDRIESHETSSSETMEDEERKEATGPENS